MAGYWKKIVYLDYLENGMKIKNAGFVRLEENEGRMRMEVRVKNIPEIFEGQYELKADVGGTAGRISLSRGGGGCCVVWKAGKETAGEKRLVRANGIYVRLPGRHLLQAVWQEPVVLCVEAEETEAGAENGENRSGEVKPAESRSAEAKLEESRNAEAEIAESRSGEAKLAESRSAETEIAESRSAEAKSTECRSIDVASAVPAAGAPADSARGCGKSGNGVQMTAESGLPETAEKREAEPDFPEVAGMERGKAKGRMPENAMVKSGAPNAAAKQRGEADGGSLQAAGPKPETASGLPGEAGEKEPVCYGDKWEQLIHMYPVIHPFGDDREYLSIAPKDFVVLHSEYQKLVHNSFLLHGYYNYRHLILGKIKEKGEECFYLGVPGNFYGREKMVAEMFGFEAFEGERQPAKAGDFGYFMKRVEI